MFLDNIYTLNSFFMGWHIRVEGHLPGEDKENEQLLSTVYYVIYYPHLKMSKTSSREIDWAVCPES